MQQTSTQRVLRSAIDRILRVLLRAWLRNGLGYGELSEMVKRALIDIAATQDHTIPGRKLSASRIATITGLTRRDVARLLQTTADDPAPQTSRQLNRAARVISGWVNDREFLNDNDESIDLKFDGSNTSITALVRRYGGDVPPRAVLDELLRIGAVTTTPSGEYRLTQPAYIPHQDDVHKLTLLGQDVADLIATIDHNVQHGTTHPRFQRKTMYDNIPRSCAESVHAELVPRLQAALKDADKRIRAYDRDHAEAKNDGGEGRVRLGVGIYYFEEPLE